MTPISAACDAICAATICVSRARRCAAKPRRTRSRRSPDEGAGGVGRPPAALAAEPGEPVGARRLARGEPELVGMDAAGDEQHVDARAPGAGDVGMQRVADCQDSAPGGDAEPLEAPAVDRFMRLAVLA